MDATDVALKATPSTLFGELADVLVGTAGVATFADGAHAASGAANTLTTSNTLSFGALLLVL